jgi:hypothetical protein
MHCWLLCQRTNILSSNIALERSLFRVKIISDIYIQVSIYEKGIAYGAWDPRPALKRYNALIKEDNINTTPTCVIIQNGQKKAFVGRPDIVNAPKSLP